MSGRLAKRLNQHRLGSYAEYFKLLTGSQDKGELQMAVDLLTTNETSFFREPKHFEFLRDYVGDMTLPIFYLAGPPGLVVAATKTVLEAGAAPAHVLSEEFSGYESRPIAATPAQTAVNAANFIKVAQQGELAPGQVKSVAVNGMQIALCNVDGVYYAIDDACTHRSALLSEGDLIGKEITCPLHGAIFDVTTGEVLEGPAGVGRAGCTMSGRGRGQRR